MEAEQTEIFEFLRRYAPWKDLPEAALVEVAGQVQVGYFKAGSEILALGETVEDLHLIRSGAVELYRRNGDLYNRLSDGDLFGQLALMMNGQVRFPARAIEDSLIYFIPQQQFRSLFEHYENFADYVEVEDRTRLRQAVSQQQNANELMTSRVRKLVSREAVSLPETATVAEAAGIMSREGVSALLVLESQPEGTEAALTGIITDKDLRTRVIAGGLPYDTPLSQIMTPDPTTVVGGQFVFEAMLLMMRGNIHHLPVVQNRRPVGVVALADIVQYESQNSLFVVSSIFRAQSLEELQQLVPDVKACFIRMVNEDANSHMIGCAMSVIGRTFKQRLLELAEEALGPPPIPYCFLALGSMARDEQLMMTDQDNALVLDNRFIHAEHDGYFRQLAALVCDGLASLGYSYCKGDIMATNRHWRQPLRVWEEYFNRWIHEPSAEGLLNSSIFFDLDGVAGETAWADQLKTLVARKASRNSPFLACMARNAMNRKPPLGFFKDFVVEQDGEQRDSMNLKRRGTAPLTDLIRVHALAAGSTAQNSFDRINDVIEANILPHKTGPELRDALEFVAMVRIRHQAARLEEGKEADNNVRPDDLTHFERRSLKDAFQLLSNAQNYLKLRYPTGRRS
ncbi:MAG: putative nucleotidyltransferase substrate binding domain-containing protein [Oleiphilaceae bacterium]|nr:putative nucleotidyltransferase substrate binding domain-containing protein [Oleiphilaceae bacterium]